MNSDCFHLVDIALLVTHRKRGIGRRLIQQLIDKCETNSNVLYIPVLRGNPALRLYQRMGLKETSTYAAYIQMEWTPGAGRPA